MQINILYVFDICCRASYNDDRIKKGCKEKMAFKENFLWGGATAANQHDKRKVVQQEKIKC